jgi:hypothetical protein
MCDTKIYHIYLKDKCVYHSLPEEEFHKSWSTLNYLTEFLGGDYKVTDLSYEELVVNKKIILESSH